MKFLITFFMLLTSGPLFAMPKILVVLSGERKITLRDGRSHETGYFLSELAVPLQALMNAGFEPVFATPTGRAPTMDKISDSANWFGGNQSKYQSALNLVNGQVGLRNPYPLKEIVGHEAEFDGVLVPGGHAPMEDLYRDSDLGKILLAFHQANKVTALICHGPVALLSTFSPKSGKDWIYRDYQMTSFSTAEEQQEEPGQDNALGGFVRFYPDQALQAAGGKMSVAPKWTSHVVRDRELITAQNPMSDGEFARVLLAALAQQKKRDSLKTQAPRLLSGLVAAINRNQFQDFATNPSLTRLTAILGNSAKPTQGYATFFIGLRQDRFPQADFSRRIQQHIRLAASQLKDRGLIGYYAFATIDFEAAIMVWKDEASMNKAFREVGPVVSNDAAQFLETVIWQSF